MFTANRKSVVIVDDEEQVRTYLRTVLTRSGYECHCYGDSGTALSHFQSNSPPDLLLADIRMPGMTGMELLRQVRSLSPELPFILVSGLYELSVALEALRHGASDYLLKPAYPDQILRLVAKHLADTNPLAKVRIALDQYLATRHLSDSAHAQLLPLFETLGRKRIETLEHSQRVAAFSLLLGRAFDLPEDELAALELGALLHDVGKAAIPHNVLMKPGPLDDEEWRVMKMHPRIGWELLSASPGMELEAEIVYCHHERYAGGGYPRSLRGADIPRGARIFSVADTIDAICSNRTYRSGQELAVARQEIIRESGAQFDPAVVERLAAIPDEDIHAVQRSHPEGALIV
jgi:response regulator RpfG family c-di-GMP phosphodiesterase